MSAARMVWLSGIRMPMPIPWMVRAKIRKEKLNASPDSTEPSMNSSRPMM